LGQNDANSLFLGLKLMSGALINCTPRRLIRTAIMLVLRALPV
jgi:hypothetical protein